MKYRVVVTKRAERQIRELPSQVEKRMRVAISRLADNPRPAGTIKLKQGAGYRIRVGDYRIIYDIIDRDRVVIVQAALHRSEAYRS